MTVQGNTEYGILFNSDLMNGIVKWFDDSDRHGYYLKDASKWRRLGSDSMQAYHNYKIIKESGLVK